jgi:hypothetical protein
MDLTAGAANALLPPSRLPLKYEPSIVPRRSSIISEKTRKKSVRHEHIYEEPKLNDTQLKSIDKNDAIIRIPTTKISVKSIMKKGVSEPNLAKTSQNRSPFSPRGLFDRFKRILPLSSSKLSLNDKSTNINDNQTITNDSDDSASTSSENNDNIRSSKLDHVSRVKSVCDSLGNSSHMSSL